MAKRNDRSLASLEDARHLDAIIKLAETHPVEARKKLNELFQRITRPEKCSDHSKEKN